MQTILMVCFRKFLPALSAILGIFPTTQIFAQSATPLAPPSFALSLSSANVPTAGLPSLDNSALAAQAELNQQQAQAAGTSIPFQIAEPQEVSLNLNNSGTWETLPDGDRIWRLRVHSPGATDLYLLYDQWRLVKPCELYLYNDDRSMVLGPYTYIDNWDGTNVTPITLGDAVTLEYYVPAGLEDVGEISVMRVLHGFRHFIDRHSVQDPLDNFGDSMPCHINVRCFPEWQDEKRAVAMIINPEGGACTGAMLNDVPQSGQPNFLTANHCLGMAGDWTNWIFYFNYESPQCNPNANGEVNHTISNATLLASHASSPGSDFALLRLSRRRPDSNFIPRYEAWDRHNIPPQASIGIHHPAADVKKIHYDTSPAEEHPENSHWRTHIDLGMMEPGSSGSPLYDEYSRIVGQLQGGTWDCDPGTENTADYGKFSMSWDFGDNINERLREHLDPGNTGAWEVDAFQPVGPPNDSCGPFGENIPVITSIPYSHSASTIWAANNTTNLCPPGAANTAPDVVYALRLNCEYQLTVSLCGSDFDTQVSISNAACGTGLPCVVANDDFCGLQSEVTFTAGANEPYTILVDGFGSASGNYTLNVTGFPTGFGGNTQCPGYEITEVPYFTYAATWCGGDHVNPECRPNDAEDVHYYWVSPYNQAMRAKTCFINYDTILEVRYNAGNGSACGDWLAGCNDDTYCGLDALASSVVFDAYNGGVYFIHLDGYNGATGMSSLELEVYNDDCSSPIVVPSLPANYQGDTRPAGDDFATIIGPNSKEVFFQYTSPTCQTVIVSTCDANYTLYDSGIEVRTGGSCPGSTVVGVNDDYAGCGLMSRVDFSAEANRTYYIIIGGFGIDAGQFMVYFNFLPGDPVDPLADVCPGISIPSLPFTDYGNTACMANHYTNCVGTASPEMVYYLNRPQCEEVTVTLCGSGYDTGLGVYGGVCPNIAPLVICNDDNYCGDTYTLQSTVTFQAAANTNYQILVHGYSGNFGPYVINVSSIPCVFEPPAVADVVSQFDLATGNVVLNWGAVPGADVYHVYRSSNFYDLFNPANIIASVSGTSYICAGCINDPQQRSFFGVIAESSQGPNVMTPEPPRDITGLTKNDAVELATIPNPGLNPPEINREYAAPDKPMTPSVPVESNHNFPSGNWPQK